MKTSSSIKYLVPELKDKVVNIMQDYAKLQPKYYLEVKFTYRSPRKQKEAFENGYSTKDGYNSFSRHNFLPSFAVDFWVYSGTTDKPLIKPENFYLYQPLSVIAQNLNLFWGGWWKHLCDGPHIEIPKAYRTAMVQSFLNQYFDNNGYDNEKLIVDGMWGQKTTRQWEQFCYAEIDDNNYLIRNARRLNPKGWNCLWNLTHPLNQFKM